MERGGGIRSFAAQTGLSSYRCGRLRQFEVLRLAPRRLAPDARQPAAARDRGTGHRCIDFDQNDERYGFPFANGAHATADVVVAADGMHSMLQQFVVPPSAPLFSGSIAYRGVVAAASVSWPSGAMRSWLGTGAALSRLPVRADELINYVGFVQTDAQVSRGPHPAMPPPWLGFAGWDPTVRSMIARERHVQMGLV